MNSVKQTGKYVHYVNKLVTKQFICLSSNRIIRYPAFTSHSYHLNRPFHTSPLNHNQPVDRPGQLRLDKPSYQLSFTCKKCETRSSHNVTKQAYHNGTVLIQCPGCKSRHLIADHLKIFSDERITLEDILKVKGENITKGSIDVDQLTNGDLELEQLPESLKEKLGSEDKK